MEKKTDNFYCNSVYKVAIITVRTSGKDRRYFETSNYNGNKAIKTNGCIKDK